MPLSWNPRVSQFLGKNYNLSLSSLKSFKIKLEKNLEHLVMVNDVFKTQEKEGIIEKIDNIPQILAENPQYSFLLFMEVFRLNKQTTKCKIVFLSNLVE